MSKREDVNRFLRAWLDATKFIKCIGWTKMLCAWLYKMDNHVVCILEYDLRQIQLQIPEKRHQCEEFLFIKDQIELLPVLSRGVVPLLACHNHFLFITTYKLQFATASEETRTCPNPFRTGRELIDQFHGPIYGLTVRLLEIRISDSVTRQIIVVHSFLLSSVSKRFTGC